MKKLIMIFFVSLFFSCCNPASLEKIKIECGYLCYPTKGIYSPITLYENDRFIGTIPPSCLDTFEVFEGARLRAIFGVSITGYWENEERDTVASKKLKWLL